MLKLGVKYNFKIKNNSNHDKNISNTLSSYVVADVKFINTWLIVYNLPHINTRNSRTPVNVKEIIYSNIKGLAIFR